MLAALTPAMLFVPPLLAALAATAVLAGVAVTDAARARDRPPEPPSPPGQPRGRVRPPAQREKINSRITVRMALIRIEPRQPTRFEKKRNMAVRYPVEPG
ncbi:hypothetical protein V6U89_04905 [Micromonospora sp. CPCC 206171]|uniref:hypothetical protein n=1 Tax=Micromonospora sp. CPCC 206171 TaxID=3122405 RepID=UPI002FF25A9E